MELAGLAKCFIYAFCITSPRVHRDMNMCMGLFEVVNLLYIYIYLLQIAIYNCKCVYKKRDLLLNQVDNTFENRIVYSNQQKNNTVELRIECYE